MRRGRSLYRLLNERRVLVAMGLPPPLARRGSFGTFAVTQPLAMTGSGRSLSTAGTGLSAGAMAPRAGTLLLAALDADDDGR